MTTKPKKQSNTVLHLRASLEELRSDLVGLEALANSAKEALEKLPYMSRPAHGSRYSDDEGGEYRLTYGRLTALVEGVAEAAKQVLAACDEAVEHSYEITEDDENGGGDEGGGNGPEEPGAPSGHNGGEASGHNGGEPDTEMRPGHGGMMHDSGTLRASQVSRSRSSTIRVCDFDSGVPGSPRALRGNAGIVTGIDALGAPQAPRSRGGIALDASPVPPELEPFIWTPAPLAVPGAPIPWAWQPWASA